jgi:hypothetical protein
VRRLLAILGLLAGLFLGGMWLYAAAIKAADPDLFAQQIRGYGIFPSLAGVAAPVFLWVELLLGLTLLLRVAPRWSLLGTMALLLVFIGITAYAWSQGKTDDCGCFGRLGSRSPNAVILEDSLYVALAAFAYWVSPWRSRARPRWIVAAALLPVVLAAPWIAPRLPVDSLVTGIRPGYNIERLAADDLKVDLGSGAVFVALLGENCRPCLDALPLMAALNQDERGPRVVGVFAGDRARKRAWALEHVPAFPLAHSPEKALRQYYRKLPVFLLAREGKVTRIWWGQAPSKDEVIASLTAG